MKVLSLLALLAILLAAFPSPSSAVAVVEAETEADEVAVDIEDEVEDEVEAEDEDEAEDEVETEDEDEVEEEEEETDEAEDEVEDEAEDEAEEEAEEVVQLETTADAEAEFEAALGENAAGEWHVYSDTVTEKAHEGICQKAYDSLSAAEKARFNVDKLKQGAIWNDMPSGVETDEAAMIKDGHMDVDTWTRLFMVTGGVDDLVFNVHYGCLQHLHSMAPIQRTQAKANPSQRLVFTNQQVKDFIKAQLKAYFATAVSKPNDIPRFSWYIGHILHAIQDSYPRGHVVRASTATSCGDVILFQGYDAQHGNSAHKGADYSPTNKNAEKDASLTARYNCAKDASAKILRAAATCAQRSSAACSSGAAIDGVLEEVYKLAAGAANRIAGGSDARFAKPAAATDSANFVKEVVGSVTLYNLKSNQIWGKAGKGTKLCGGTRPIQSKAPTGFGVYREKDFRGYVEFTS